PNAGRTGRATRAAGAKRSVPSVPSGWSVQLAVHGSDGRGGIAYVGQSDEATKGFDSKLDIRRPPEFTRASPVVSLSHSDCGAYFYPEGPEPSRRTETGRVEDR